MSRTHRTIQIPVQQSSTDTIPILGTTVTEYGVALELDGFNGTVGRNISGTSDLAPLSGQADMVQELFPEAKTVGLLYCSGEANSRYQVDTVKGFLEAKGYTCEYYAFSDSDDLSAVVTQAVDNSDVIYVPTDNTCANNTEIIRNMKDAIAHGNRLIMMMDGNIILDIRGEEKKRLTVSDLLHKFEEASGEEFASDKATLG